MCEEKGKRHFIPIVPLNRQKQFSLDHPDQQENTPSVVDGQADHVVSSWLMVRFYLPGSEDKSAPQPDCCTCKGT